ncbi:head-tail adaptor protein [Pseudomonadota bacterium]|nr:head-tail adaptor protein [Pseudomonadota bacterium]
MKNPEVGELNRRITIKDWQDTPNADAGIDQVFSKPIRAWAKRQPVGAGTYHGTKQIDEKITDRFYIRWRSGLTIDADKVLWLGDIRFRVKRASNLADEKRFIVIEVEELGRYG